MTSLFTHLSMYILVISVSQLLMLLQCMLVGILAVVQSLLLSCKMETVPMRCSIPFPLPQDAPSILLSVNMEPTALGACMSGLKHHLFFESGLCH